MICAKERLHETYAIEDIKQTDRSESLNLPRNYFALFFVSIA